MKKSVLIAPVLGILLVGAAGSVGGTVAWFSAVNTFSTSVSSFAVGRVDGALDVTMTAVPDLGTRQSGEGVVVGHSQAGDVKLTHGSFKHNVASLADSVYTIDNQSFTPNTNVTGGVVTLNRNTFANKMGQVVGTYTLAYDGTSKWSVTHTNGATLPDGNPLPTGENGIAHANLATYGINYSGTNPSSSSDRITVIVANAYRLDGDWMRSTTALNNVFWYYAVSWQMTFSYTFGVDATARNIYLNVDDEGGSSAAFTPADNENPINTGTGFRLAFHNSTTRNMIWAPNRDDDDDIHYVTSTSAIANYANTAAESLVYDGESNVVAKNAASGAVASDSAAYNYIGQITGTAGQTQSFTVDCVAWFEGSDPSIMNTATMDSVTAVLNFFALPAAA